MQLDRTLGTAALLAAVAACHAAEPEDPTSDATAYVTGTVPADATCTHIIATRLADFHESSYQGVLSGAFFKVATGETRVTATAYPQPCNQEPAQPPWLADDQLVTFADGPNTLTLHFHDNTSVAIDPVFDGPGAGDAVLEAGSTIRTGRNGEDAAAPDFSLDGWEVKQIPLPPIGGAGTASETVLFSLEGKGNLGYTPRGLAALADGTFVVQLAETSEPLRQFDATGNFVESWPVVYPMGTVKADNTDGLEAIDATHLVRTGYLNNGIDCDAAGNCTNSLIEILERFTAPDGSHQVRVAQQLFLPAPYNAEYPVGVTPIGSQFAVTTLPGGTTHLLILNADGSLAAGPTSIASPDVEGLFVAADGRLGGLDYHGHLAMYDAATAAPRPGEVASFTLGIDLSTPNGLAWDSNTNTFLALSAGDLKIASVSPAFDAATTIGIDLSGYNNVSGMDFRADTNQLLLADRIPPVDPVSGTRIPTVDFYDLATAARVSSRTLQGLPLPVRTLTIAYVGPRQQLVGHYRRPGGTADPTLDAVAFTHNLDGSLAASFDLAPIGVTRIVSIDYLASTDELLLATFDEFGVPRFVVTSSAGTPKRSYRVDAIGGLGAVAPITSGPLLGQVGMVINQPSVFERISLP